MAWLSAEGEGIEDGRRPLQLKESDKGSMYVEGQVNAALRKRLSPEYNEYCRWWGQSSEYHPMCCATLIPILC